MRIAVFCALGLLLAAFLFTWMVTRIRYRIASRHVKVLLFGICIRRLAFDKIDSVSKRRGEGLAENWWSTMRPKHRMLVLRRKRGLFKNFVITPKNRYIFKTELERAMQRAGLAAAPTEALPSENETNDEGAAESADPSADPNLNRREG